MAKINGWALWGFGMKWLSLWGKRKSEPRAADKEEGCAVRVHCSCLRPCCEISNTYTCSKRNMTHSWWRVALQALANYIKLLIKFLLPRRQERSLFMGKGVTTTSWQTGSRLRQFNQRIVLVIHLIVHLHGLRTFKFVRQLRRLYLAVKRK